MISPAYANSKVMRKFENVAILNGYTYFFKPLDAIRVIEEARTLGISVLGIDGAVINNYFTQPNLEHSIDYSDPNKSQPSDIYEHAIDFVRRRSNMDIYFEVVLDEPPVSDLPHLAR